MYSFKLRTYRANTLLFGIKLSEHVSECEQ